MKKELAEQAIQLTSDILEAFYRCDPEPALKVADPEITWIGSREEQFDIGYEQFASDLKEITSHMFSCELINQNYYLAQNNGRICTVIGSYIIQSAEETKFCIDGEQRCSAVWRADGGTRLTLMHLSINTPIGVLYVDDFEKFPITMEQMLKRYTARMVEQKAAPHILPVADSDRALHFIDESMIYYLQSDGKYTLINLENQQIRTRMLLKEFDSRLGDTFFRISRSDIVNITKVSLIKERDLTLTNGIRIPIPIRSVAEIRQRIMEYYK